LRNVAQVHVQVSQMALQANGFRVLKTAHALINADSTYQQRLGLSVLILERVDIRQLIEQDRHRGLFRLWQLFSQTQSTQGVLFDLAVVVLLESDLRQAVKRADDSRVIRPRCFSCSVSRR